MDLAEPVLELRRVTFGYTETPAVEDVAFRVDRGEFVGLVGPNGSGKSTLVRLMSGVLVPRRGEVLLDGCAMKSYRRDELGRMVAVVPQETAVSAPYSVMEIVLFGRMPYRRSFGFETDADVKAARLAMERTETSHLAARRIDELSGGERQRVVLARALAQEPSVLLLDEPTTFLDLRHQVELYDLLRDLAKDGMTVLTVLHDLNLAALYCERLMLLRAGRLAAMGVPSEILTYSRLTEVFGTEIYVTMNDITGTLNVLPLSRPHRERLGRK